MVAANVWRKSRRFHQRGEGALKIQRLVGNTILENSKDSRHAARGAAEGFAGS
jgi:hypothetical protein